MKMNNEFKTGIVVVMAIVFAVIFWLKTTDLSSAPYRIKTYFTCADGIKPETIVRLAGIDVGRIEKLKLVYDPDTRVELTMVLDKNAKVREDSIAFISTSGIVGDSYVGLTNGSANSPFLKEGAVVASEDPIQMRILMKKAESIADNLDKTLVEVKGLATNLNGVVKDNKSRVDNIARNLEDTSQNFKEFSDDIKKHPWKLLSKK